MNPGDRIGEYTIISLAGEGGMSFVYLAEDTTNGSQVVVKELKHQYLFNRQVVDRFVRGATILKDLRHPHLARVFDCLERDGRYFIVEEYLAGGSLADLLVRSGPPTTEEALGWCRDVLRAMNYAHEHGIVHRDLKPSNLMLDAQRQVKVIDFGIARAFGEARLTRTSDGMIGTLQYMSLEQILTPGEVDHLTDVYSAGVVLYELLTGNVPFDAPTDFAIQEKIARQPPPAMRKFKPGIDPGLERMVFKAIEKHANRRYGGCGEFAGDIDRYLKREPAPAWTTSVREGFQRLAGGFPRQIGSRVAIGLLLLAMVLFLGLPTVNGLLRNGVGLLEATGIRVVTNVDPTTVSAAGTVVNYRYTVTNTGNVALKDVKVVDRDATPPTFASGDANANGSLDTGETWLFESKVKIEQTHLDSGTALVSNAVASSDRIVSDPYSLTLRLDRQPAIAIAALVDGAESVQLRVPRSVLYTYKVSNSGNVSLTGVRVTDWHDRAPLLYAGDSNRNNVLDVGEMWEYGATVGITGQQVDAQDPVISRAVAVSEQATSTPDAATVAFVPQPPTVVPAPRPTPVVPAPRPTPVMPAPRPIPVVPAPQPIPVAPAPRPIPVVPAPQPIPVVPAPQPIPVVPAPQPIPVVPTPPPPTVVRPAYQGPRSGILRCPARTQVVQNGEVVLPGLPPGPVRLSFDTDVWEATVKADANDTQRVILTNKRPGTRRECTVKWQLPE